MRNILASIKSKLATVSSIKHVALWRNQINKMEDGKQDFLSFPAVFVEFLPGINFNTHIDNIQTGEGTVRIHIVEFDLNKSDENILDLRDAVHIALQGLRPEDDSFSPLVRVGSVLVPSL